MNDKPTEVIKRFKRTGLILFQNGATSIGFQLWASLHPTRNACVWNDDQED